MRSDGYVFWGVLESSPAGRGMGVWRGPLRVHIWCAGESGHHEEVALMHITGDHVFRPRFHAWQMMLVLSFFASQRAQVAIVEDGITRATLMFDFAHVLGFTMVDLRFAF